MRRRDWLKSLAVLAVVPMIGVRKAVASAEAVPETLPGVAPAPPPPAAEPVAGPSPRVWPPEAIWINGEPSDGAMAFGGPRDGEVMTVGPTKYMTYQHLRCCSVPIRGWSVDERVYEMHQYSRERIVLSTPNVRIFLDVWCYAGAGLTATPESKAAALKWAHKNYGHLISDSYRSAADIRRNVRGLQ
jgi:hypothetical protein